MGTGTILDYEGMAPSTTDVVGKDERSWKDNTRASEHAEGYLWQGPWQTVADGFAEHCRRAALALAQGGVPVLLRGLRNEPGDDPIMHAKNEAKLKALLEASISRFAGQIFMMVPTERFMEFLLTPRIYPNGETALAPIEQALVDAHRVFYTVWERDRLSRGAVDLMKKVGQCWVACQANAEMLIRSGVARERVRIVPCPHFPDDPHLALQGRQRKPGPPRFYHIGKWEPRKAQDKILEAFVLAFSPSKGCPRLSMRTGALAQPVKGFPQSPEEALGALLERSDVRARGWTSQNVTAFVRLYKKRMSEDQLMILHRESDVYVTLSRGEGFDMPAMDAKLSGNLMLYTPSGGPQEFAGVSDIRVAPTGMVPAHEMYEWQDTQYLDYSVEEAANHMQFMADCVASHDRLPHIDLASFTAAAVGARMHQYLGDLSVAAEPVKKAHRAWAEQRDKELKAAMEAVSPKEV